MWVTAGGSPDTFRMAGEAGASLLTHLLGQSVDELAEKVRVYREAYRASGAAGDAAAHGRLAACRYFFRYELPKIDAWLGVVASRDDTCRTMADESF